MIASLLHRLFESLMFTVSDTPTCHPESKSLEYLAEFLPHIKVITVCIGCEKSEVKSITTSNDGTKLLFERVTGDIVTLKLPVDTVKGLAVDISKQNGTGCLSFKLPSHPKYSDVESVEKNQVMESLTTRKDFPWSCAELRALRDKGILKCCKCNHDIIDLKDVRKMNEMPSENWSEMMEYWHCDRPEISNPNSVESIRNRFEHFHPTDHSIIVGQCYFIINCNDFGLVTQEDGCVHCPNCNEELGVLDKMSGNTKLWKWELQFTTSSSQSYQCFSSYLQCYSLLMDSISSTAIRFYVIMQRGNKANRILVWCFSFGLGVVLSTGPTLKNCMKLFYKANIETLKANTTIQYDTISLDTKPFASLMQQLRQSNEQLPDSQRMFKDWNVGYLPERFM